MANMYIGDQALGTVAVVTNTAENLDSELTVQDDLIAELQAALQGKAAVASEDLDAEMTAQDEAIASQDDLIAQIAAALEGKTGDSGGSVETVAGNVSYLSGSGMYGIYYEDGSGVIHAEGAVGSGLDDYVDIPETIEVRKGSLLTLWSNEVIDGGAYNGVLYDTCFNNKTGIELVSQYLNSATVGLAILKITDNFTIDFSVEDPF